MQQRKAQRVLESEASSPRPAGIDIRKVTVKHPVAASSPESGSFDENLMFRRRKEWSPNISLYPEPPVSQPPYHVTHRPAAVVQNEWDKPEKPEYIRRKIVTDEGMHKITDGQRCSLREARPLMLERDPNEVAAVPLYSSFSKDHVFRPRKVPLLKSMLRKDSLTGGSDADVEADASSPDSSMDSSPRFPPFVQKRIQSIRGLRPRSLSLPERAFIMENQPQNQSLEKKSSMLSMIPRAESVYQSTSSMRQMSDHHHHHHSEVGSGSDTASDSGSLLRKASQGSLYMPSLPLSSVRRDSSASMSERSETGSVVSSMGSQVRFLSVRDSTDIVRQVTPILKDVPASNSPRVIESPASANDSPRSPRRKRNSSPVRSSAFS
jgi:hypothetical protein